MEAKDFRVDNWINVLNPNTNGWKYEKIKAKTILNFSENPEHYLMKNNFKPIPITEEWLLKFGFKKVNSTWWQLGNLRVSISLDVEWGGNWIRLRLKHVHQLQNLYFALTGKELELK